jgi:hypothetical protein
VTVERESARVTLQDDITLDFDSTGTQCTIPGIPALSSRSVTLDICTRTGLPESYEKLLGPAMRDVASSTYSIAPAASAATHTMPTVDWHIIPKGLTEELAMLPWEHVFGGGVLVRDCKNRTSLLSIAQAAVAQLSGLTQLLESLVWGLDRSMRICAAGRNQGIYEISWRRPQYLPVTALATFGRTVEGSWIVGLENGSQDLRQLHLDAMDVMAWIQTIFSLENASQGLVVQGSSANSWQRTNVTLDEPLFAVKMGIENSQVEALEAPPVISHIDRDGVGCWRKKIKAGIILACRSDIQPQNVPRIPPDRYEDCLTLTAAALWTLFDDDLSPMLNCSCTFRSVGGDFLRCLSKIEDWYVWHIDNEEICGGRICNGQEIVTFTGDGRLHGQSPCILGWPAEIRSSPKFPIAKTIGLSPSFEKNVCITSSLDSVQIQGQLGWQGIVSAQVLLAANFKMKRYTVENSMPCDPELAIILSEQATVLIYCEERRVHLTMHGADVIETLCVHRLKELCGQEISLDSNAVDGTCDGDGFLPRFVHSIAVKRMETWRSSTFTSRYGTRIAGESLVREAGNKLLRLINDTKAFKKGPLYWSLKDLLRGTPCDGMNSPSKMSALGWFKLWKECPILILAVGCIDDRLISSGLESSEMWRQGKGLNFPRPKWNNSKGASVSTCPGALLSGNRLIRELLQQSSTLFPATLTKTNEHVPGHPNHPCFAIVPKESEGTGTQVSQITVTCPSCKDMRPLTECLHYFC